MTVAGHKVPRWSMAVAFGLALLFIVTMIVLPTVQIAADAREQDLGWPYVFLLFWRDLQQWLSRLDWMTVFGAVLIVGTIVIFFKMSRGGGKFDFADAFAGENGKTSMAKVTAWIGALTASWIMVALAIAGKMSEGYIATYLGILVLGKVGTEMVGVFRQAQIARTAEAGGATPDQQVATRRPLGKREPQGAAT